MELTDRQFGTISSHLPIKQGTVTCPTTGSPRLKGGRAGKLLITIYTFWKNGEPYAPNINGKNKDWA